MVDSKDKLALARWRLVLGQFAESCMGGSMSGQKQYAAMDRVLDYLYGREYSGRGVRQGAGGQGAGGSGGHAGGSGESVLMVPEWIRKVRELFPQDVAEVIQSHALDRYGMTELVTDAEVLRQMEPNYELLKAVLTFKGMMSGEVLEIARQLVHEVVEDLQSRLAKDVRQVLWGRLNKLRRSRLKVSRNLDWSRTIKANLKNFDSERKTLVLESLHFFSRVEHHMPWHIIMAVDCSGSMMDSVIYSAVMAGIFHELPSVRVNLVAFDTSVVDLTDDVHDPTEMLMSVQLGGGTDIHGALSYCETLVQSPHRTIVVLVTDFYEGASPAGMIGSIRRLREGGARVIGLAALDDKAQPVYDHDMAQQCVNAGAEVAALTPRRLAEWLGTVLS